jgi:hypothetical protein
VDPWTKSCVWNGIVYFVSLHSLGVPIWKNIAVTAILFVSTKMRYGAQWVFRGGVLLMFVAIAVWLGALPPLQQWPDAHEVLAKLQN